MMNKYLKFFIVFVIGFVITILVSVIGSAFVNAKNTDGRWDQSQYKAWFDSLQMPDSAPDYPISCCGEADAFPSDNFRVDESGKVFATVTDGRGIIRDGLEVEIPSRKFPKTGQSNPTGRGWLFLSRDDDTGYGSVIVYCWVMPGGF